MSFFEEDSRRLRCCVEDIAALGATHLVVVDGAYALFPEALRSSSMIEHDAIEDEAYKHGLGYLAYTPEDVWVGNEVEKRQVMLQLAQAITTEDDFLMPWDADFILDEKVDLRGFLEDNGDNYDFADVQLTDSSEDNGWYWVRLLLRARRDLRFGTNHYTYLYGDGLNYKWPDGTDRLSTVVGPRGVDLDIGLKTSVRVWHRPNDRQPGRREKQVDYYQKRDSLQIEV